MYNARGNADTRADRADGVLEEKPVDKGAVKELAPFLGGDKAGDLEHRATGARLLDFREDDDPLDMPIHLAYKREFVGNRPSGMIFEAAQEPVEARFCLLCCRERLEDALRKVANLAAKL